MDHSFDEISMISIPEEPMDGEFNPSEYDLGAGGPPIQQEKTIESELEQIMEKSFAEKAVKLSEIRVKYEM